MILCSIQSLFINMFVSTATYIGLPFCFLFLFILGQLVYCDYHTANVLVVFSYFVCTLDLFLVHRGSIGYQNGRHYTWKHCGECINNNYPTLSSSFIHSNCCLTTIHINMNINPIKYFMSDFRFTKWQLTEFKLPKSSVNFAVHYPTSIKCSISSLI